MIAVASPHVYLAVTGLGALAGALAVAAARRSQRLGRRIADAVGALLVADIVAYVSSEVASGTFSLARSLPLALCNALVVVAAWACFCRARFGCELTWFLGLAGSLEGLVTPDLSTPFPHLVFFEYVLGHLGVVTAACILVIGLGITPRRGAVARVFLVTLGYAAVVGLVDLASGANYLFLRRPPGNWTVLRILGPWPVYIPAAAAVTLALLVVLDLPFARGRSASGEPALRLPASALWSLVVALALVVFPLMAVMPGRRARWRLLVITGRCIRWASGVRLDVTGVFPDSAAIICPNHESFLDGLVVVLALGTRRPATFLVSRAIGRQLVAGVFLRLLGAIFVGGAGASARRVLSGLAGELAAQRHVVVFPEGSVAIGPLRRLHAGAFVLALDAGRPVVPLAISGSGNVLPPGSKGPRPGAITVVVGQPIPPDGSGYRAARELGDKVGVALAALLDGAGGTVVSSPGSPSSC